MKHKIKIYECDKYNYNMNIYILIEGWVQL